MASVEKHGKKFRGTYTDENGRRRKTRVFPTKRAARQCAEEQEARLRSGTWRDPSTGKRTLTEYVEDPDHGWLRLRREERTTRDGYRSHWNQIKPVLEHYELRRLRSSVIQAWVNEQEAAGVTPITIKARFTFLQTVLAAKSGVSAIRDGELRLRAQLTRPSRAGPAKDTGGGPWPPPDRKMSRWRRRPTRSTRLAQPDSIRTLNGARSPLRRHPRRRSTRQSRSLDSPGVGESALVEFASSLVLTSARRPPAHQPTRGALEQLAGQHGLGLRPENCAQLGPADRPRTRLPAYPRRARRASALRAPTDQPRSRSKDQVEEA